MTRDDPSRSHPDDAPTIAASLASAVDALAEYVWLAVGDELAGRLLAGDLSEWPSWLPGVPNQVVEGRDPGPRSARAKEVEARLVEGLPAEKADRIVKYLRESRARYWHHALREIVEVALGPEAAYRLPSEWISLDLVENWGPAYGLVGLVSQHRWRAGVLDRVCGLVGDLTWRTRELHDHDPASPDHAEVVERFRAAVGRLEDEFLRSVRFDEEHTALKVRDELRRLTGELEQGRGLTSSWDRKKVPDPREVDVWLRSRGLDRTADELCWALDRLKADGRNAEQRVRERGGWWDTVPKVRAVAGLLRLKRALRALVREQAALVERSREAAKWRRGKPATSEPEPDLREAEVEKLLRVLGEHWPDLIERNSGFGIWLSPWAIGEMTHAVLSPAPEPPPAEVGKAAPSLWQGSPQQILESRNRRHFGTDCKDARSEYEEWLALSGTPPWDETSGLVGDEAEWVEFRAREWAKSLFGKEQGADDDDAIPDLHEIKDAGLRRDYLESLASAAEDRDLWDGDEPYYPAIIGALQSYAQANFVGDDEAEHHLSMLGGWAESLLDAAAEARDDVEYGSRQDYLDVLAGIRAYARLDLSQRVLDSSDPARFARYASVLKLNDEARAKLHKAVRASGDAGLLRHYERGFSGAEDRRSDRKELLRELRETDSLDDAASILESLDFDLAERIERLGQQFAVETQMLEHADYRGEFSGIVLGWLEEEISDIAAEDEEEAASGAEAVLAAIEGVSDRLEPGVVEFARKKLEPLLLDDDEEDDDEGEEHDDEGEEDDDDEGDEPADTGAPEQAPLPDIDIESLLGLDDDDDDDLEAIFGLK